MSAFARVWNHFKPISEFCEFLASDAVAYNVRTYVNNKIQIWPKPPNSGQVARSTGYQQPHWLISELQFSHHILRGLIINGASLVGPPAMLIMYFLSSCSANFVVQVARQALKDRARVCMAFLPSPLLLQPSEEEAVKDWPAHGSGAARHVYPRDLRAWIKVISGKLRGKHDWRHRYLARHKKSISTHKPQNLDPKHAQDIKRLLKDPSSFGQTR